MNSIVRLVLAGLSLVFAAGFQSAFAQTSALPKTIRLVVPFPPGNASDFQARLLGEHLQRSLGITVVVDNRPGASGAIALQYVATSKPDGSTLLVSSTSPLVITPAVKKSVPYNTERDFAPVALLGFNDVVLLASPGSNLSTLPEMVADARRRPDALTYASIGAGTLAHLVLELTAARAGVRMRHIPYKGSAQAYTDLMSGEVSVMADGLPQALSQIKAGKLKALAVFSKARSPFLPSAPTVASANLPGLESIEVVGWTGLLAPAGTPREIVSAMNAEAMRIFGNPEVRQVLAGQSLQAYPRHTPEDFATYLSSESAKWRAMAKAARIEGSE